MDAFDNAEDRFGSAGFADAEHLARLGFNTHSSAGVLVGFNENGPLYVSDAGGIVTIGGARSGKGACVLGYTVAGGPDVSFGGSKLIIDPKSELASISRGCAEDGIHAIYCLGR